MKGRIAISTVGGSLEEYRPIVGDEQVDEIRRLADPLRGARVLHLSFLAFGTATSELLSAVVPLLSAAGLYAEWRALQGNGPQLSAITTMYEALGGADVHWNAHTTSRWEEYCDVHAASLKQDYDYVVVHDPQPAAVLARKTARDGCRPSGSWIWHSHLDLSQAQARVWDLLRPHLESYDLAVYEAEAYVRPDVNVPGFSVMAPTIDPLGPRNVPLFENTVADVLRRHGVDPACPILSQVGRLDRFSDPEGALEVYRLAKKDFPRLQLVLVALMGERDTQAQSRFEEARRSASGDNDVHLISGLSGVSATELNALQVAASVAMQMGLRKGNDLHLLEAMWKGRPVVADHMGASLPVDDGITSFLAPNPEEAAVRVVHLLRNPDQAAVMGKAAAAYVRHGFLITRYVRDYLRLFQRLENTAARLQLSAATR